MKRVAALALTLLSLAAAAPALVWKSDFHSAGVHIANEVSPVDIFGDLLSSKPNDSGLSAVVFLLGRGERGSERLSTLAANGSLKGVASKYDDAHSYHHVSGVLNSHKVATDVSRANPGHNVVQVSLGEFYSFMHTEPQEMEVSGNGMISKTAKIARKKAKALANAHVVVVSVDSETDPSEIDSAVVFAIDNKSIQNVILSAVRSVDEVKHERDMEFRRRLVLQEAAGRRVMAARAASSGRRRLEEADQAEENANADADMSDVHFVSMTPNILAGILFFFLFAVIANIGITCMGMIQGQDVFVSKMPSVGREM